MPGGAAVLPRATAYIGLSFLETALRQNHVRRITDSIALVEHAVADRRVEVEISLRNLDAHQRDAGVRYSHLRTHDTLASRFEEPGQFTRSSSRDTLWVPLARFARTAVAPVDVRDETGLRVSHLTQHESSLLVASGLYRLLMGILRATPDASTPNSPTALFVREQEEPRWLLQAALIAILTERGIVRSLGDTEVGTLGHSSVASTQKVLLASVLDTHASTLATFFELLDVALANYLFVVAVNADDDEKIITYSSPITVTSPTKSRWWVPRPVRELVRYRHGYGVSYRMSLPTGPASYHLVVHAPHGVDVQSMALSTNVDVSVCEGLAGDLESLAEALSGSDPEVLTPRRKFVEIELQSTLRRVGSVVRRRLWAANSLASIGTPEVGRELKAIFDAVRTSVRKASGSPAREAQILDKRGTTSSESALFGHPDITPESLQQAARAIRLLGHDLVLENDPASNRGHIYWRHANAEGTGTATTGVCRLVLEDATPARPANLSSFVLAVFAIVATLSFLTFQGFGFLDPRQEVTVHPSEVAREAMIVVLLLIPGFLYSRLDLPPRHSILGRLRGVSRLLAYSVIGIAAILAGVVAAGDISTTFRWTAAGSLAALALVGLVGVTAGVKSNGDVGHARSVHGAPEWVRVARRPRPVPFVEFSSTGSGEGM
jgi:hypothetical protein